MINLKFEDREVKLRNRFDEITMKEFDEFICMITNNPGVRPLVKIIESLCEEKVDFRTLSLGTYMEVLDNFLVESIPNYIPSFTYDKYSIKVKNGELDLTGKQVSQLEKVYKSSNKDKSCMIVSILFAGEYNEELFKIIQQEKASEFVYLLNMINPIKINV